MVNVNFNEALKNLQIAKVDVIRKATSFSFGTVPECKKLFEDAFKYVDHTARPFIWQHEYDHVVNWMHDTRGKGLFLTGDMGRGKSVIIMQVIPLLFHVKFRKNIHPVSAEEIPNKLEQIANRPFVCIDDLGTEAAVNNYGERFEGFMRIVNVCETNLKPLFVSSNLNSEQIMKRYDERTLDRIARLCKVVKFEGVSLRPQ
ncbi:hypothetical protein [Prolixibacter denitrificans]|uniref:DNA replication protein DnaC n=1 Tax=Prolixibacter denitrificans TaxID=1541063 RepID=A0A2P8CJY1_9BACT|nr:hypothetical protein [Prolixibacter denitrificans]PSK85253.1 hypothetical protein CLV93_101205 [Prolixibacter denitrificans]GET19875.1 hypothetical protein JCM18694_01210 [Prolixibacter denitrificans]